MTQKKANQQLDKSLAVYIEKIPDQVQAQSLAETFAPMFSKANEWSKKAQAINVTSADQTDLIAQARELRLELKSVRTKTENRRKELKADYLLMSKAIDGMANVIKAMIVPVENHLKKQEQFVQLQIEEKRRKLKERREAILDEVEAPLPFYRDVADMSEQQFSEIVDSARQLLVSRRKEEEEKRKREELAKRENERRRQELLDKAKKEAKKRKLWSIRFGQLPQCTIDSGKIYYKDKFIVKEDLIAEMSEKEFNGVVKLYRDVRRLADEYEAQQQERTNALIHLSLAFDGEKFVLGDTAVYKTEVETYSPEAWERLINRVKAEIESKRKIEEEKQRRADAIIAEEQKRLAEEQKEIERQQQLEKAGDRQKISQYASSLYLIKQPTLKSTAAIKVLKTAVAKIDEAYLILTEYADNKK